MSRQLLLKAFIIGMERSPLPEGELAALGLSPATDPAQSALEALAAANLAAKAGFHLTVADSGSSSRSAEADERPICPKEALEDLKLMLSGRYADAMPEFLDLLAQKKLRLPSESLPELLDKAERDFTLREKICLALDLRGRWLAQQNPHWAPLLEEKKPQTSLRARRKGKQASNSPLLEFEAFAETWPKAFLESLLEQYRPAVYGEDSVPSWHFTAALLTAAYHCQPADAVSSAFVRDYLQNPPKPRPREFEEFLTILRFRQEMRRHLGG